MCRKGAGLECRGRLCCGSAARSEVRTQRNGASAERCVAADYRRAGVRRNATDPPPCVALRLCGAMRTKDATQRITARPGAGGRDRTLPSMPAVEVRAGADSSAPRRQREQRPQLPARRRASRAAGALPAQQRADRLCLHRPQLLEQLALRGGDVQRGRHGALPVPARGGPLHVAGEVPGVAVDGPAAGPVAEERQPGGVRPGPGRARRPADEPELLAPLRRAEEPPREIGPYERADLERRRDDPPGRPGAARAQERRELLRCLTRRGAVAVDERPRQRDAPRRERGLATARPARRRAATAGRRSPRR